MVFFSLVRFQAFLRCANLITGARGSWTLRSQTPPKRGCRASLDQPAHSPSLQIANPQICRWFFTDHIPHTHTHRLSAHTHPHTHRHTGKHTGEHTRARTSAYGVRPHTVHTFNVLSARERTAQFFYITYRVKEWCLCPYLIKAK